MTSVTEIRDYFIHGLHDITVQSNDYVPLMSKHLKGYVLDGRHIGIDCNKFPAGVEQFTEIEVIYIGSL